MRRYHLNMVTNKTTLKFKHWAIILELSNKAYINIQFGRNGFSLNEFNNTENEEENVLDAILDTWGEVTQPFSFCFLGNANFEYEKLKEQLKVLKEQEKEFYQNEGKTYYNFPFRNCQHFACDIEKILFGKIKIFHLFSYYLNEFFDQFFIGKLNILNSKYDNSFNE